MKGKKKGKGRKKSSKEDRGRALIEDKDHCQLCGYEFEKGPPWGVTIQLLEVGALLLCRAGHSTRRGD